MFHDLELIFQWNVLIKYKYRKFDLFAQHRKDKEYELELLKHVKEMEKLLFDEPK
jgi:hypothetical protein